jgi:hypothetical protein
MMKLAVGYNMSCGWTKSGSSSPNLNFIGFNLVMKRPHSRS